MNWKLTQPHEDDPQIDDWSIEPKPWTPSTISILKALADDPDVDLEEIRPGLYRTPGGCWNSGPMPTI